MMDTIFFTYIPSPVGNFLLAGRDGALTCTSFTTGHRDRQPQSDWREDAGPFSEIIPQFTAYFEGEATQFDIPLRSQGTDFQKKVWQALTAIPYGRTWSYGDLARKVGNPNASRAVGAANGANPLPVIVPCHRVIGASGKLTGFGGGLDTKATLLRLEGLTIDDRDRQLELI
ncbi:methylated-DNA--[protein]-cysteine S-methyltransferase [Parvularcula sp. IMCC14364]|uniref:methylated-DNA--[protein]-cysteine S-methyltransferase n=1 Tax=Parvularcula sp. IMCC14364 TaxID=3067902 RepID=UPI002740425F|nr:methylated-DNA--[protein]-cysteine S-methyltransferase [Parvularcula sp. IMCC14364]